MSDVGYGIQGPLLIGIKVGKTRFCWSHRAETCKKRLCWVLLSLSGRTTNVKVVVFKQSCHFSWRCQQALTCWCLLKPLWGLVGGRMIFPATSRRMKGWGSQNPWVCRNLAHEALASCVGFPAAAVLVCKGVLRWTLGLVTP